MGKTIQIMIDKRGVVTNGDVIKAMFPNGDVEYRGGLIKYHMPKDNCVYEFLTDWWNAPYREGDNDAEH